VSGSFSWSEYDRDVVDAAIGAAKLRVILGWKLYLQLRAFVACNTPNALWILLRAVTAEDC
jgi:hypothetical protein